jgi:hypothetical protein
VCCLSPIFAQVYRPLPPGGNPIAVNKYLITSYSNTIGRFKKKVDVSVGLVKHHSLKVIWERVGMASQIVNVSSR